MAVIQFDPTIPRNIHERSLSDAKAVRTLFECGEVVVLKDVRVLADFEFLASVEPPHGAGSKRGKYVFWRVVDGVRDGRGSVWETFRTDVFAGDGQRFEHFKNQIQSVDKQIHEIVLMIFKRRRFLTETITWKFQRNRGENMHIDNLIGSDKVAQVRLFVNLDNKPRRWSVGCHWRHYAERELDRANLGAVAHDPCKFNHQLSAAAFGVSTESCDEPRHFVEFEPGEVWLANSALVAHQVRGGDVLALAHHEYPYGAYIDRSHSLPALLNDLVRRHSTAPVSPMERMKKALSGLRFRRAA